MPHNLKSAQTLAQGWKSSIFAATSSILTAALVLLSASSSSAGEDKQNYIAPSVGFVDGGNLYGITAKLGVAENISVRPFIQFNSSSTSSLTAYGASITQSFTIPRSGLIPYAGGGIMGSSSTGNSSGTALGIYGEFGVDYNASESLSLNVNYKTPYYGGFNIGVGYRF